MTRIVIRAAEAADMTTAAGIYRPAVLSGLASWEYEPPDVAEMTRRYEALRADDYPYLVAEKDGEVAGYAYVGAYRTRPGYRWTVENSIYVAAAAQGHGLGRRLLEELIAQSQAKGYRQMLAVIGDSANMASIALHRRAGFTFCGTLHSVGFKHGRWLDSVMMQRPLGHGDTAPPEPHAPRHD